jgi:hypothetical protein
MLQAMGLAEPSGSQTGEVAGALAAVIAAAHDAMRDKANGGGK